MQSVVEGLHTSVLALPGLRRGKVRDVYTLPGADNGKDALLIIASDRISAFDVVMPTAIADKGRILTHLSTFWLRFVEQTGICKTHLISTDVSSIGDEAFPPGGTTREQLKGRATIARKARVVPIECVVRGYLEGSGWKEYQQSQSICGVKLPAGLRQCDRLPQPIFTPATKEELGKHDENISFDRACEIVGETTMRTLRDLSLRIYEAAAKHAQSRGIIIADTKFEFGTVDTAHGEELILVDEALTPDSSRFWPADSYSPGKAQKSFDKQYLREWLEELVRVGAWNKQAPGPALPPDVVNATLERYRQADALLSSM